MELTCENVLSCKFCKKIFKTVSSLNLHIKSAKKCLQNRPSKISFQCKDCLKNFTTKQNLNNHQKLCITLIINQKDKEIEELRKQLDFYKHRQLTHIDIDFEDFEKFCVTTFINNIDFFTEKRLYKIIVSIFFKFLVDPYNNIPLVICSDKSRYVFKYKDKTGNIFTDVKAYVIMARLEKSFINISNAMKTWFYDVIYNSDIIQKNYNNSYTFIEDCKNESLKDSTGIEYGKYLRRKLFIEENKDIYSEQTKIENYIKWDRGVKDFYKNRFENCFTILNDINDKFIYKHLSVILPSKFYISEEI